MDDKTKSEMEQEVIRDYNDKMSKLANQIKLQIEHFKKEANQLKTDDENTIKAIQYFEEFQLTDNIAVQDVALIKEQAENELKYLVLDRELKKVATINEDFTIEINPEYLKHYESYIGKPGEQTPGQQECYDYEASHKCQQLQEQEQEKEEAVDEKKRKIAQLEDQPESEISSIVEITNKSELGAILNTDIPSVSSVYIVKFKNGDTKICIEQGESMEELACDIRTQQVEDAIGKHMDIDKLDGTKLRANELKSRSKTGLGQKAHNYKSGKQCKRPSYRIRRNNWKN